MIDEEIWSPVPIERGTTCYAYDSHNRVTTITDARNIVYLQNFFKP